MANRTYLFASESESPISSQEVSKIALAAGKNSIPVYWYSLFDESCVVNNTVTLQDGRIEQYPYLVTSTSDARKRLSLRRRIFARFSAQSSRLVTEKWFAFVEGIKLPFLHIDPAELWMMLDSPDCETHILDCLAAFDVSKAPEDFSSDDGWLGMLDVSQIDSSDLSKTFPPFRLAGLSWGPQPVPWDNR